jgi:hypothetical protein
MEHSNRKRLALVGGAVTTVAAGAALIAGATFGFFSSAGSTHSDTFTAGNVVVGLDGSGTQVTCLINPMSPGDASTGWTTPGSKAECRYDIKYTGNVNAFMAMDISITGAGGTPVVAYGQTTVPPTAQGLYDSSATGLQINITDDASVSYMSGVSYTNESHSLSTLTASGGTAGITKLLVTGTPITTNQTKSVRVNYFLPTGAGNAYDLAASTVVLRIHAVQADNNALPVGCAAGELCTTGMTWS